MFELFSPEDQTVECELRQSVLDLASAMAAEQNVTLSELFRRALHTQKQWLDELDRELNVPLDPADPNSMTQAQLNALIKQSRSEDAESRAV